MNETLRPSTLGEILDRTAQLYRRNFWLFAGVAALPIGVIVRGRHARRFGAVVVADSLRRPAAAGRPAVAGSLSVVAVSWSIPVCIAAARASPIAG